MQILTGSIYDTPWCFLREKTGRYWQKLLKQGHNFELLLQSQENNSFLTAHILSGMVNDVYKEFILAHNKKASPYIDANSGVALVRYMLNHNIEQKYTK